MKQDVVFDQLVRNALDFLDKAIREFEKEPKYSVINFCAAIELFLKARLLHEHRTLILTKPEKADLSKFEKGDFHSVSLDEAERRLSSIANEGLSPKEIESFVDLRNHRNRMVHFFHAGQQSGKEEIERIVSQQCRAWFYLHHVITQRWKSVFSGSLEKVVAFDKEMQKQRKYLNAKFSELKDDIANKKKKGITFWECPACRQDALREDSSQFPLLHFVCVVCEFETNGVRAECPGCGAQQAVIADPWHTCTSCDSELSPDNIKEHLIVGAVLGKDDLDEPKEVNCGECEGHKFVISLGDDVWFYVNCFTSFDRSEIDCCQWCHEWTTADVEDTYWSGCEFCGGSSEWHKGD